jgi:hypothetical protein
MSDVDAPAPGVNAKPLCLYEHSEALGACFIEPPPEVIRTNATFLTRAASLLRAIELDDSNLGQAAMYRDVSDGLLVPTEAHQVSVIHELLSRASNSRAGGKQLTVQHDQDATPNGETGEA